MARVAENIADYEGWYSGRKFIGLYEYDLVGYMKMNATNWTESLAVWISESMSSEDIIEDMLKSANPLTVAEDRLMESINNSGRVFEFDGVIYEYRLEDENLDEEIME